MSPAFIKGVRDNLPEAKITFDKFHILKIINTGVDKDNQWQSLVDKKGKAIDGQATFRMRHFIGSSKLLSVNSHLSYQIHPYQSIQKLIITQRQVNLRTLPFI